jgi:formate hydrogenlyase subunit 3/multisubunit Na+/H+ antiporter MnhD subunit
LFLFGLVSGGHYHCTSGCEAHPVAPSNISALLSGVLIKTGIYGLTRVLFDFLGTPPNWWGVTVLTIGTVSAVLGVLYALMEHDLKRLLAYHSIENIGIILMGLGASLMFLHTQHPVLAALALIAGLYHTINHAIFKALLFLGAGAVLHSTTRNREDSRASENCFSSDGGWRSPALPP